MTEKMKGTLAHRLQAIRKEKLEKKSPELAQRLSVENKGSFADRLRSQTGKHRKLPEKLDSYLHNCRLVSISPREAPRDYYHMLITRREDLLAVSSDATHKEGNPSGLVRFHNLTSTNLDVTDSVATQVAWAVMRHRRVIFRGAGTSLTEGAVPQEGDVVFDMSRLNKILDIDAENNLATVQPGVTFKQLQDELRHRGLYYPPGPTEEGATFGGMIACNAAGAATFKYGQTRPWVKELEVVLANGEILNIKRGERFADKDGYFEYENASGTTQRIKIPTYTMPDVPKSSAGYYAKPGMDLIDLFIGSEGTLGVITKATVEVIPRPTTNWALVPCESEEKALELTRVLRELSITTQISNKNDPDTVGIDVSAIEYIDEASVQLLREDGKKPPASAKAILIIQLEQSVKDNTDDCFQRFLDVLAKVGIPQEIPFATPDQTSNIEDFRLMRDAVPRGVNKRVGINNKKYPSITKAAGDMIVPFDRLGDMLKGFRDIFSKHGLKYYNWGHFSDGNTHPNILAETAEEMERAKVALLECAQMVIDLKGSPLSEHGVGESPTKQKMLEMLVGPKGIREMQDLKHMLDPDGKFGRGKVVPWSVEPIVS